MSVANADAGRVRLDQSRICFGWMDGDALNVEIVNYH